MLVALGVYVRTAARDIVYGDTPELTAVALTFGVAHPPGYPIFTMIGWLFGQVPVGPPPFRVALLSVVCHAATVGVVYVTTYRFVRSIPAAAIAAMSLAFEPLFWYWSLVVEVFPLNDLLAAVMLLLVALWHEHPERRRLLIGAGFVGGLGMANHQTIALLSPAVFYVMWQQRTPLLRDPRIVLNTGIAFLVGLVPYVELLFAASAHPALSWGDLQSPADLMGHVLRVNYGTGSLLVGAQFTGGSPIDRLVAFVVALDPLRIVLLTAGTWYAWRTKRWYATYLLIAFVISGPAFVVYSNANVGDDTTLAVLQRFFLMPQAAVAPLAGFVVPAVGDLAARIGRQRPARAATVALALVVALAIVPAEYGTIDQSDNHYARSFGMDVLATLKPNTVFLGSGDPVVFSLAYLQSVEHVRPDVTTISLPLVVLDWYIRELRREHPSLVLSADRYGATGAPMRVFLDENKDRPISAIGSLPDNSATDMYWFYSRGIVFDSLAVSDRITLGEMVKDNESILPKYHPPRYGDVRSPFDAWERLTLVDYSLAYYRMGSEYEKGADSIKAKDPKQAATLYEDAKSWYRRALGILPTLAEAQQGLARIP